jgi:2-pyrone-4,6-dicarboxylate lactonase
MTSPPLPTFHANPARPRQRLPAGAWDTHCHVQGPRDRFAFAPDWPARADAPKERLFALHDLLGIERCVIVQSGAHGMDNRVVEDALEAKGGAYLGVALLPPDVRTSELRRLDRLGFRGVRYNFMQHLHKGASIEAALVLARRLADIGWHLQIHMEAGLIADMAPRLTVSPVPVDIDHMGRIDAGGGLGQKPFQALLKLLERPHVWVKVSGIDRLTRVGPPYADAIPFARRLVGDFPDRVLWGTDWPHPNHQGPVPDDGALVDALAEIAPMPAMLQKLMVDNPARLYDGRASA